MSGDNQDSIDELLNSASFGDDQEATGRSYNMGGGIPINFGGSFSHGQSNPMTVSRSVLVFPARLPVAAFDPMPSTPQRKVNGLQRLKIHQGITRFFLPNESDRHKLN